MRLPKKKLQELKNKKISIEELNDRYFDSGDGTEENILKLLNENVCSFKDIVDKFKSMKDVWNKPCLWKLLENKDLFQELIKKKLLNKEDLKYLLNTVDIDFELWRLCYNTLLIKYILNEFVLDKETVDKLNAIVENNDNWRKSKNIHTIFDLIEDENRYNKEVLNLSRLNKKVYLLTSFDLNKDQRDELIELIQHNEIAKNRLIQIVNSHLESNYDFDSLMRYLKKKEKKNVLNI